MAIVRNFDFPDGLHYLVKHDTWARLDANGVVTIGITALGAHISGTFVTFLPKLVGAAIERDRSLGTLEMSKVVRAVRSPITGKLVEANAAVTMHPQLINRDPYGAGWLVRILPSAWEHDSRLLVTDRALPAAVAAYMDMLSETFGENRQ